MEAPENNKAGGAGALPARDYSAASKEKSTPTFPLSQHPDGTRTAGAFLGTALRHAREAASLNLRHGPGRRVGREIDRAREALDSARWICDYCGGER